MVESFTLLEFPGQFIRWTIYQLERAINKNQTIEQKHKKEHNPNVTLSHAAETGGGWGLGKGGT